MIFQLPPSSMKGVPKRFVRIPISIEQVKDSRYTLNLLLSYQLSQEFLLSCPISFPFHSLTPSRYLLIPLFEAERSWSYGMELREEFERNSHAHRTRHHAVTRMKRATFAAEHLLLLCKVYGGHGNEGDCQETDGCTLRS